jgi:hypothetical protein
MSRSGYTDDCCDWSLIRWRGQVASAIRGKRGQKLLVDLYKALESMENKELIAKELETSTGGVCALGALGKARGLDMTGIDVEDSQLIAEMFGVADQLAREIVYLNDETFYNVTPAQRYDQIKEWVLSQILPVPVDELEPAEIQ